MRKIILGIVLIGSMTFEIYAQSIKTYTGNYSEAETSGQVTYQYYENDNYERIYNGDFKFTTGNPDGSKLTNQLYKEVTGKFKENWKDGLWSYKWKNEDITGYFKMGLPNGEWIFNEYDFRTNKFVNVQKATYKDGKLSGAFYFKGNLVYSSSAETNGVINDEGYLDGNWTIKWGYVEDIRKYKNGILYFRLVRDTETGFVAYKVDSTNFINEIFTNLDKENMTSNVGNTKYQIANSYSTEIEKDAIFDRKRDYYEKYNEDKYGWGKDYTSYVKDDFIIASLDNWHGKFYGITKGEKDVKNYYKRTIINFDETEEGKSKKIYETLIAEGDKLFEAKKYETAIKKYNSALSIKKEEIYPKSQMEKAKELLSLNVEYEKTIDKAYSFYRSQKYDEAIQTFQLAIEMQDKISYPFENTESSNLVNYSDKAYPQKMIESSKKEKLTNNINSLKIEIEATHSQYAREYAKKQKLYSAYLIIYNYQVQDLEQKYEHLLNLKKVQENLRGLLNENSKSIEKQLSGVTDYQTILNILNTKQND